MLPIGCVEAGGLNALSLRVLEDAALGRALHVVVGAGDAAVGARLPCAPPVQTLHFENGIGRDLGDRLAWVPFDAAARETFVVAVIGPETPVAQGGDPADFADVRPTTTWAPKPGVSLLFVPLFAPLFAQLLLRVRGEWRRRWWWCWRRRWRLLASES